MDPNVLFAGIAGKGMFRSLDGGDTWQAINTGFDTLLGRINTIAFDVAAFDLEHPASVPMFVTFADEIYKSIDLGITWRPVLGPPLTSG
ncbi:MAG: hypothetical protein MPN21_17885 [Thermoanaerobaculia bacterium]|nr:hypothetical protein [Thermoanaerobaculia bacterium]